MFFVINESSRVNALFMYMYIVYIYINRCTYIDIYVYLILYQPAFVDPFGVESLHISPIDGMVIFDEVIGRGHQAQKPVFLGIKWTTTTTLE